jgi:hypothetical protein
MFDLKSQKGLRRCLVKSEKSSKEYMIMTGNKPFIFQLNDVSITRSEKTWFLFNTSNNDLLNLMKKLKVTKKNSFFGYFNESCEFYNLNKNKSDPIIKRYEVVDIIAFLKLEEEQIIDEKEFNVKFEVLQLKKHEIDNAFDFRPSTENQKVQGTNEDLPEKYQKMLKMGIPMDAIKQKMAMDNLNQRPKAELLRGISLKKTEQIKQKPKDEKQFGVSLLQIQSILKRLKPVN